MKKFKDTAIKHWKGRLFLIELKKGGGELFSGIYRHQLFKPLFRILDIMFSSLENVVNEQSGERKRKVEAMKIFLKKLRAEVHLPANMHLT